MEDEAPLPRFHRSNPRLSTDRNLHLIVGIALSTILGIVSVNPVLPTIAQSLQVAPDQIGLVISAYVLPIAFGAPILGILADRVGRKVVIIPSLVLFAIAGVLCSTAPDFRTLLAWRFLQGVGAASLELLALTLIGDLYAGEAITSAMAFLGGSIGISSTVFPLLGGILATFNWRWVFFLPLAAVGMAVLVLTNLKLPVRPESSCNFSIRTYAIDVWRGIKSVQMFGLFLAVVCVFALQFGPCYIYIPMIAAMQQASSSMIGAMLACTQIFLAIFSSQIVRLSRRWSDVTLIKFAFLLFAIAFLLVPFMPNVWLLFVPCLVLGAAEAFALCPTRALIARLSPPQSRAGFMSTNILLQSLGQVLGPTLFGIIFGSGGIRSVFFACAGLAVAMIGILNLTLPIRNDFDRR